jgi:hypothetical protein
MPEKIFMSPTTMPIIVAMIPRIRDTPLKKGKKPMRNTRQIMNKPSAPKPYHAEFTDSTNHESKNITKTPSAAIK